MSDSLEFDDVDIDDEGVEPVEPFEVTTNMQRHDVRRKIEDLMERRRLREEFGELDF
jgi:hypothetical protein